jgi:hypothetical protein
MIATTRITRSAAAAFKTAELVMRDDDVVSSNTKDVRRNKVNLLGLTQNTLALFCAVA